MICFFVANGKKLPADKAAIIREKMAEIDDSRYVTISSVELEDLFSLEDSELTVLKWEKLEWEF